MATIEEILAGTDARFYDGRDSTFDANNIFSSGFNRELIKTMTEY